MTQSRQVEVEPVPSPIDEDRSVEMLGRALMTLIVAAVIGGWFLLRWIF
jgi:hypothetical protein